MHELTEITFLEFHKPSADFKIREWLTKKAEELQEKFIATPVGVDSIKQILGLCVSFEIKYVEAKAEKEKWCEHIRWEATHWIWKDSGAYLGKEYLFCEFCGKPRPKEPKELAEVLKEAWWSKKSERFAPAKGGYEREADAAINWMLEIVESKEKEFQQSGSSHMNGYVVSGMIKDELKRKVKGE